MIDGNISDIFKFEILMENKSIYTVHAKTISEAIHRAIKIHGIIMKEVLSITQKQNRIY